MALILSIKALLSPKVLEAKTVEILYHFQKHKANEMLLGEKIVFLAIDSDFARTSTIYHKKLIITTNIHRAFTTVFFTFSLHWVPRAVWEQSTACLSGFFGRWFSAFWHLSSAFSFHLGGIGFQPSFFSPFGGSFPVSPSFLYCSCCSTVIFELFFSPFFVRFREVGVLLLFLFVRATQHKSQYYLKNLHLSCELHTLWNSALFLDFFDLRGRCSSRKIFDLLLLRGCSHGCDRFALLLVNFWTLKKSQ